MCFKPEKIKNKYTGQVMYVPCGHCDDCLIQKANLKALELSQYMVRFKYRKLVTLTYDNYHLPCVMPDTIYKNIDGTEVIKQKSSYIYRRIGDRQFKVIKCLEEPLNFELYPVTNVSENITGVLFYVDVQNFFKAFRKFYVEPFIKYNDGRKYKRVFSCSSKGEFKKSGIGVCDFKIFVCCEYGTQHYRPHYHILFLSNRPFRRRFQNHIIQNWQMCDWNKLKLHVDDNGKSAFEKSFEDVFEAKCGKYVASYVGSYINNDGFHSQKGIRPQTRRSKDTSFSVTPEISKAFAQYFEGFTISRHLFKGSERPFEQIYRNKDGSVSSRLLPTKILSAYIRKPKDCFRCGIDVFRERCISCFRCYFEGNRKKVDSTDYLFILAYRRYCAAINIVRIDKMVYWLMYINLVFEILGLYESEKLRLQMMSFKKSNWTNYLLSLNQTSIECVETRLNLWSEFLFNSQIDFDDDILLNMLDLLISYDEYNRSKRRVEKYQGYLIGKHCNEYKRYNSGFINF